MTEGADFFDRFPELCRALDDGGAFLVVQGPAGKVNAMTIGWATLGIVWSEPILTVLVRPSRHTFGMIEKAKGFSVNVPAKGKLGGELAFCGSRSGRDVDKLKACGLKTAPGRLKGVTVLPDCALVYECETVEKAKIVRETMDPGIVAKYYKDGDFHTVYFGRVLHAYGRNDG